MVTQNMLRTYKGNRDFSGINIKFAIALDQNECLKQVKLPISLHKCPHLFLSYLLIYVPHNGNSIWPIGTELCFA